MEDVSLLDKLLEGKSPEFRGMALNFAKKLDLKTDNDPMYLLLIVAGQHDEFQMLTKQALEKNREELQAWTQTNLQLLKLLTAKTEEVETLARNYNKLGITLSELEHQLIVFTNSTARWTTALTQLQADTQIGIGEIYNLKTSLSQLATEQQQQRSLIASQHEQILLLVQTVEKLPLRLTPKEANPPMQGEMLTAPSQNVTAQTTPLPEDPDKGKVSCQWNLIVWSGGMVFLTALLTFLFLRLFPPNYLYQAWQREGWALVKLSRIEAELNSSLMGHKRQTEVGTK